MEDIPSPNAPTAETTATHPFIWCVDEDAAVDVHVAFRATFVLEDAQSVDIWTISSGWFEVFIDGVFVHEGPTRYEIAHPEYNSTTVQLAAGSHVIAVHAYHCGVATEQLPLMVPFLGCWVLGDIEPGLTWRFRRLDAYESAVRRINPNLAWVEWCDTRLLPDGWKESSFLEDGWSTAVEVRPHLGPLIPPSIGPLRHPVHELIPVADGLLVERLLSPSDDPTASFTLRDRSPSPGTAEGRWFRYDLGRIRLGRPRVELDVPAGAIVELGYAEALTDARVAPYIAMSNGPSANLDHYVARGGPQVFGPVSPRGLRFLEAHVVAPPEQVRPIAASFVERTYFGEPEGQFRCGDDLLDQIWRTSVETLRVCTEDAIVDCPTRERGQWLGDAAAVAMEVMSVAYGDLRLVARALRQAAWCASDEGFVAGVFPGQIQYLASFAAQWISGCVRFAEHTGDLALLEELFPAAQRNIAAFRRNLGPSGLAASVSWPFIDWGYDVDAGAGDLAMSLHLHAAVRDMVRWAHVLGDVAAEAEYDDLATVLASVVSKALSTVPDLAQWEQIGFHATVLALRQNLVPGPLESSAVAFVKAHMLASFPNDAAAPRLARVDTIERQLITPYFAHFSLPVLIERGETDFVLDQYRSCWGWALEAGLTTWPEVFDLRWSLCHQWSGAPAWQLSRYLLGLHPRLSADDRPTFDLRPYPGSLAEASGTLPIPGRAGMMHVRWQRHGNDHLAWTLEVDRPVMLHLPASLGWINVERSWTGVIPIGAADPVGQNLR